VANLLDHISPRTSPELARGLIEALGRSEALAVGVALAGRLPSFTPAVRQEAIRVLLRKNEWTNALLGVIQRGQVSVSDLALDQQQALLNHPDRQIAGRARRLIEARGGLPDPDRQKVIDTLRPVVEQRGDAAAGKLVFKAQCAKCHTHAGEGTRIGPDLTGMAAHSKEELLVHVLDPSRSVEGNYRVYTVVTAEGQTLAGLLASETKTTVELVDAEARRHTILREEIEALQASSKSLMPEGFEKQLKPEELRDLLEFLTQRGRYVPLPLDKVATIVSTRGMFYDENAAAERLIFADWGPKTFAGVPFVLVDPQGGRTPNVILLHGPQGTFPPTMPRSVSLPCHLPAKAVHLLSGIAGWGYPYGGERSKGSLTLLVRLYYADGQTEEHPLRNGEHFADYIRRVDVPGSQFAFDLAGRQVRYLSVPVGRSVPLERIELVKGEDRTAPVVVAVTVETRSDEAEGRPAGP
jgi:putative heme-binding domain-containing protein